MGQLKLFTADRDGSSEEEPTLATVMHGHRVRQFVERNGLDALPPAALRTRLDEDSPEDVQLQQLTSMLQAQRVLHGLNPDGTDPNARAKPRPAQTMPVRRLED